VLSVAGSRFVETHSGKGSLAGGKSLEPAVCVVGEVKQGWVIAFREYFDYAAAVDPITSLYRPLRSVVPASNMARTILRASCGIRRRRSRICALLSPRIKPVSDTAIHEFWRVVMNIVTGLGDHDERAVPRDIVPHA